MLSGAPRTIAPAPGICSPLSRKSAPRRNAREILCCQLFEIIPPISLAILAELEQIIPAENSGRMQIVEHDAHRVIADWVQFHDFHVALAGDGPALCG